jgi:hypothetical protein
MFKNMMSLCDVILLHSFKDDMRQNGDDAKLTIASDERRQNQNWHRPSLIKLRHGLLTQGRIHILFEALQLLVPGKVDKPPIEQVEFLDAAEFLTQHLGDGTKPSGRQVQQSLLKEFLSAFLKAFLAAESEAGVRNARPQDFNGFLCHSRVSQAKHRRKVI